MVIELKGGGGYHNLSDVAAEEIRELFLSQKIHEMNFIFLKDFDVVLPISEIKIIKHFSK